MSEYIMKWNPDLGSTMMGKIEDIGNSGRLLIVRDSKGAIWGIEKAANITHRLLSGYASIGDIVHLRRVEYHFNSGYYIDLELE